MRPVYKAKPRIRFAPGKDQFRGRPTHEWREENGFMTNGSIMVAWGWDEVADFDEAECRRLAKVLAEGAGKRRPC